MSTTSVAPAAETATVRPTSVVTSFWLWVAETVASVVIGISIVTVAGSVPAVTALQGTERETANAVLGAMAVGAIIFAVVRVVFAFLMLQGRNWARVCS